MKAPTSLSRLLWAAVLLGSCLAQNIFDCPSDWQHFSIYCYKLVGDFPLKYDQAAAACSDDGASLLHVESVEENTFIRNRLEAQDPFQRTWLTSGRGVVIEGEVSPGQTQFVWEATSQGVPETLQFWLPGQPDPDTDLPSSVIAYAFGETGYGWGVVSEGEVLPYVCKIAQAEAYRIVQTTRDFDYGMETGDVSAVQRGPHLVVSPQSQVVVGQTGEPAVLECVASALPEATYTWFRGPGFEEEVTAATDERYTLTNGRLAIEQPEEELDAGDYRCQASNKFGTILSTAATLSFGFLAEFNNVPNDAVRANAYAGVAVQCSQISYRPAVRYTWLKENTQFLRPDMQAYIFISRNGKLYFSEVTRTDEGEYKCIATLTGVNQFTIGTTQPPIRMSLPIPLLITDQSPKANWGPEIQNDFPAVFPKPPLRGQDIRIECFAYGSSTTPFFYSWRREGKPMPAGSYTEDHNRVLILPNAQLEDSGTYLCHVRRSTNAYDTKPIHLALAARPYFVAPLRDQHADVGSQLTWRCDARGNPGPTYTWYKNGQRLYTDPDSRYQVTGNVLIITDLEAAVHDGMYQCAATNSHGTEISNAQLRVLAFAPTFAKHPLPSQVTGSASGDITIVCNPEGAPFPVITWQKDGGPLTPDGSHVTQLSNGNLIIRELTESDKGSYTCVAENQFGKDSSSTRLELAAGATLTLGPSATVAEVNTSAFLACQASRNPKVDLTFVWYFNGYLLDTDLPDYTKVDSHPSGRTGLYVKNVQFEDEGLYRCTVRTAFTQEHKQAYLTVKGPPGEVAGVYVDLQSVTRYEMSVLWTDGADNGGPVLAFRIQAEDEFNLGTWADITLIQAQDSIRAQTESQTSKRRADLDGLNPGTSYRIRVLAQNEFGLGPPSKPSSYVKTLDAPPAVSPRNVRGGGGSVGDLTLQWDPLDRAEWGSGAIKYRVYWRQKSETTKALWEMKEKGQNEDKHVVLVGPDNYYILYEVKVQAISDLGQGPNSSVVEVYSAEGMPLITPTNVQSDTYNSTALEVSWVPVPDTREAVKGKVKGYQINYWPEELMASDYVRFIRYYGQVDTGLVIGLDVDVNTWVDVQVYNSAGLGPRSEAYIMETTGDAPLTYPQEVRVYSAGPRSVKVWWRGISYITDEEGMVGYVVYYWKANEPARTAKEATVDRWTFETVLTDIDESTLYALRVAGENEGGYGRKSPTQYFTFAGEVTVDPRFSQTIDVFMAPAATPRLSTGLLASALLLSLPLRSLS
ncbi:contactin-like [Babylonia areolata]|uniref:contactin-like n=1 Tax=Babylonia areolata TaxID=304850 RepID=UPI003FD11568